MIRRVALGVAASAALSLGAPARADMPSPGGCRHQSQPCPSSDTSCLSCTVGDASCIDPLVQQGYARDCQRGSVVYLCKWSAPVRAGFDFTMPLAGILLGVSAWASLRMGRRRAKGQS